MVIVVNKCDLEGSDSLVEKMGHYASNQLLGYTLLQTSVETGEGVDQLRSVLAGRSSILVGQSGESLHTS